MTILNRKGKPLNISASAIETFLDCQRKWWYGYVERIRGPKSEAALRGDAIHDLAERYLKGEVDPDNLEGEDKKWWRYLEPGLEFAPSPEDVAALQWGVEDWVKEPCGPLTFVGKVDIYQRLDAHATNADPPAISDWKTTGNKTWKWSKTPSQLSKFLQPHVYAYGLYKNNPPETVDFQHINLQSKGVPDSMEVWGSATWQEILDTWDRVVKYAEDMADVVNTHRDAEDVPANIGACRKFGGCEYADMCPASPKNYQAPQQPKKLDLQGVQVSQNKNAAAAAAALRARLLGGKAPAPAPAPTITPDPPKPVAGPSPAALVKGVLDSMGKAPANVAEQLAGNALAEVIMELGLTLTLDGFYVYGADPAPAVEWSTGETQRDFEARTGLTKPEGAKVVAGYIVPEDWDKDAVATAREFGGPEVQAAAEALAETVVPTTVARQAELKALNDEVARQPIPATPAPADTDADTRKAARILLGALQDKGAIDKGDARDLVVRPATTWRRVTDKRWGEVVETIAAIYGVDVTRDGDTFTLEGAPTNPIEETVERVLTDVAPADDGGYDDGAVYLAEEIKEQMADLKEAHAAELQDAEARGYERGVEEGFADGQAEGYREAQVDRSLGAAPTVYVNCRPATGDVVDFANWIAPFEDQVAEDQRVPYYGLVDFGKGPKLVASLVKAHLHVEGPGGLPTALFIDTFHPCCSDVLQILKRLPDVALVVGVRS